MPGETPPGAGDDPRPVLPSISERNFCTALLAMAEVTKTVGDDKPEVCETRPGVKTKRRQYQCEHCALISNKEEPLLKVARTADSGRKTDTLDTEDVSATLLLGRPVQEQREPFADATYIVLNVLPAAGESERSATEVSFSITEARVPTLA